MLAERIDLSIHPSSVSFQTVSQVTLGKQVNPFQASSSAQQDEITFKKISDPYWLEIS